MSDFFVCLFERTIGGKIRGNFSTPSGSVFQKSRVAKLLIRKTNRNDSHALLHSEKHY